MPLVDDGGERGGTAAAAIARWDRLVRGHIVRDELGKGVVESAAGVRRTGRRLAVMRRRGLVLLFHEAGVEFGAALHVGRLYLVVLGQSVVLVLVVRMAASLVGQSGEVLNVKYMMLNK